MTKKDIIALRECEETREKLAHSILSKYAKKKGFTEYKFDNGYYCFAETKDGAERKYKEWLDSRLRDKNGVILKVGDVVHNKWGYDLVVHRERHGEGKWYGMLVCNIGHSCETIPYALISEEIELLNE